MKESKFKENIKLEIKNNVEKQDENILYFWNCYLENGYKNFEINDICYLYDEKLHNDLLCFTIQNGVAIWVQKHNNLIHLLIIFQEFEHF